MDTPVMQARHRAAAHQRRAPVGSLMELAQIGATPKGGVCRLALTDLDGRAATW
jgi:hypothetical protein